MSPTGTLNDGAAVLDACLYADVQVEGDRRAEGAAIHEQFLRALLTLHQQAALLIRGVDFSVISAPSAGVRAVGDRWKEAGILK